MTERDGLEPGPLDGIRVLDFSRVLTGPHCGRMLVDLGADVIKIEPPEGDITRFSRPRVNSLSTYFVQQNCGKRNVSLDLSRPEGAEAILRLVPHADVVLENFRPGVMERLRLGYERMSSVNPRLVYATITGYGHESEWAGRAAYAATIHAEMGMMDILSRTRGTPPAHDPFSHADLYASLECVSGIIAALFQRERTGVGQRVDVSMAQTLLCINEHAHMEIDGKRGGPSGSSLTRSPVYRMRDGRYVTFAGDFTRRGAFTQMCTAMTREDLDADPRFDTDEHRSANREQLDETIQAWVETFDHADDLERALQKGRIAMGAIRSVQEATASDWAVQTGAVVHVSDRGEGTIPIPNSPWRFSRAIAGVRGEPAYRGEHNREVFTGLAGLSDTDLDALESSGVLSSRPPRAQDEA